MGKLNIAPTKSNLLTLQRQLAFAEEGYDLLEQKRQILIFELMSRLERAREAEQNATDALKKAFSLLKEATMDAGSEALDRASIAVKMEHQVEITDQHLMGMKIPRITAKTEPVNIQFGVTGTTASTDLAMKSFVEVLPILAELAELSNAVIRLAQELRKTQRRCNALSKIFMPTYRETINYIVGTLEERERESFVIMKMIRDRLEQTVLASEGE
ncbi:MAG TPA: V-type ATP synthase subunit D [Syntrophorhabdaceae bacterium]|nr:V-type ATP synthase subunit D [Syntrophorhabdaceae bacterium]HOL05862.1 V-type ATP synthase subunit D [Syntrophorhabdaceae bacterium]HON84631.1 V-type ATP synthase subunit D [Syntrophorhabdaceae bacterium]HOT42169.1 V-type ATP synthase subunit D [Syntrophorhabdaceae bacterium]HPC67331.1 V-type ATP synthase subunit D [Syntrophorhabdaceae bacterium]